MCWEKGAMRGILVMHMFYNLTVFLSYPDGDIIL